MVSAGMKCIKYILFVFNLIFYLAGIVLIVAGALVQTMFRDYFVFFGGQFNAAAILLIIVGVIVFFIGFFGCCGAYKENHCMLMTFTVLLGIVFILEVAAAIAAKILNNELRQLVRNKMNDAIVHYNTSGKAGQVWNKTQETLHCCGSVNYTDWKNNPGLLNTSSVPDSCCMTPSTDCGKGALTDPSQIYQDGCANTLINWAEKNIIIIGVVALVLAFIQIVGIIIACCLAAAIRKDYTPM
jgi:CD63 antigen